MLLVFARLRLNQNYLTIEAKKTENPDFKMDISSCNLGEQVIHIDVPMGEQGIQGVQGPPGNQGHQGEIPGHVPGTR